MSRDPINPLTLSSYEELDTELICVLTRIRLRRFWHMLGMWLAYLRLVLMFPPRIARACA